MASPKETRRTLRDKLRAAAEEVKVSMLALREAIEHMNRELDAQDRDQDHWDEQWQSLSTKRKKREQE